MSAAASTESLGSAGAWLCLHSPGAESQAASSRRHWRYASASLEPCTSLSSASLFLFPWCLHATSEGPETASNSHQYNEAVTGPQHLGASSLSEASFCSLGSRLEVPPLNIWHRGRPRTDKASLLCLESCICLTLPPTLLLFLPCRGFSPGWMTEKQPVWPRRKQRTWPQFDAAWGRQ